MYGHLNIIYFDTTSCSPLTLLMTFTYTSNTGLSALYSVITFNGTLNLKSLCSEQWSEFKTWWHWRVNNESLNWGQTNYGANSTTPLALWRLQLSPNCFTKTINLQDLPDQLHCTGYQVYLKHMILYGVKPNERVVKYHWVKFKWEEVKCWQV